MPTRRSFLSLSAAALFAWALPAVADEPRYDSHKGAVIGGYDPVGYFTEARPVKGSMAYALKWRGVMWYFASAENRSLFEANPHAYAPQFGGYCAYAASQGYLSRVDPTAWYIHHGKLYLITNRAMLDVWSRNADGNIRTAEGYWPGMLAD